MNVDYLDVDYGMPRRIVSCRVVLIGMCNNRICLGLLGKESKAT